MCARGDAAVRYGSAILLSAGAAIYIYTNCMHRANAGNKYFLPTNAPQHTTSRIGEIIRARCFVSHSIKLYAVIFVCVQFTRRVQCSLNFVLKNDWKNKIQIDSLYLKKIMCSAWRKHQRRNYLQQQFIWSAVFFLLLVLPKKYITVEFKACQFLWTIRNNAAYSVDIRKKKLKKSHD